MYSSRRLANSNLRERGLFAICELLGKLSLELIAVVDHSAERACTLNGAVHKAVQPAAKSSFLNCDPLDITDAQKHMFAVSETLAAFGQSLCKAINLASAVADADIAAEPLAKLVPRPLLPLTAADGSPSELNDRIAVWASEGGAGGELKL